MNKSFLVLFFKKELLPLPGRFSGIHGDEVFFEKKKQKTFAYWSRVGPTGAAPR
jgi:hypothetical protein